MRKASVGVIVQLSRASPVSTHSETAEGPGALATDLVMPAAPSESAFDDIVRRWCDLAERRLAHYTDLYHSGRWRHYYATEEQFAAHMVDVIKAVKLWAKLAGRQPPATPAYEDLRSAA